MDKQRHPVNEQAHRALDAAMNELHRTLHLQLDVMQMAMQTHEPMTHADVIDQASQLVAHALEQIRMIIITPRMDTLLKERQQMRTIEMQEMIMRLGLDKLEPFIFDTDSKSVSNGD